MKHNFFFFLFEFLFIVTAIGFSIGASSYGVLATGFSPSSLVYELKIGEQGCKTISVSSDSEVISVDDKWAENKDIEWKVSLFDKDASYHGISINYDSELSTSEREVEVCVKGGRVGEYHGVMLLREEQKGNSVVQMGIWVKLTVSEAGSSAVDSGSGGSSSSGSGSSSGGGSSPSVSKSSGTVGLTVADNGAQEDKSQAVGEEEATNGDDGGEGRLSRITGAVVGGVFDNGKIIIILAIILAVAGIIVYNHKNKRRLYE